MTAFFTPALTSAFLKRIVLLSLAWCLVGLPWSKPVQAGEAVLTQLRVERADDGVYLTAVMQFDLPFVVEDALLKGIPMYFVLQSEITRERWYWTDSIAASAARTLRLAYQPLTRRWRVNIAPGLMASSGAGGLRSTLNQNYDTLPEALAAIQRVARWRIASSAELEPQAVYKLQLGFKLDLSQLPRPFQIGVAGQRDWDISMNHKQRLAPEPAALLPAAASSAEKAPAPSLAVEAAP